MFIDNLNVNKKDSGIYGFIKLYKNNKFLFQTSNHIVKTGRHFLMQRMFGIPYSISDTQEYWTPRWFSVGSGGATMDMPFQPIWPADEDIDLYHRLKFNELGGPRYTTDVYKKLIDSVEYVSYTIAKLTMTIDYDDVPNTYINEAGLFTSLSEDITETNFALFSHVTFPTLPKSDMDSLTLEWYIVF